MSRCAIRRREGADGMVRGAAQRGVRNLPAGGRSCTSIQHSGWAGDKQGVGERRARLGAPGPLSAAVGDLRRAALWRSIRGPLAAGQRRSNRPVRVVRNGRIPIEPPGPGQTMWIRIGSMRCHRLYLLAWVRAGCGPLNEKRGLAAVCGARMRLAENPMTKPARSRGHRRIAVRSRAVAQRSKVAPC